MRFSRFIPVAFAAMAAMPAVASAQFTVQNLQEKFLVGNTTYIGDPSQGNYTPVGPYQAQFTTLGATPFDVYCIDWDNSFQIGSTYAARILTFDEAVSTTLTYNGIDNFTALKRILGSSSLAVPQPNPADPSSYLQRLLVESALASHFGPTPTTDWDEIHFAMWGLFNTNTLPLPSDGLVGAQNQLTAGVIEGLAPGYDYSKWRLILDESAWDAQDAGTYHQALINDTVVPEPGTYMLVGAGLIGLFGFKRRRSRAATI